MGHQTDRSGRPKTESSIQHTSISSYRSGMVRHHDRTDSNAYRIMNAVCSEIHTKHINTLCGGGT